MDLRPGSTSGTKLHHGRFFPYSPVKSGAPLGWCRVTLVSAAVATVTLLIVERLQRAFLLVEDIYRHKSDDIFENDHSRSEISNMAIDPAQRRYLIFKSVIGGSL